jgi:hypothetical protein
LIDNQTRRLPGFSFVVKHFPAAKNNYQAKPSDGSAETAERKSQ